MIKIYQMIPDTMTNKKSSYHFSTPTVIISLSTRFHIHRAPSATNRILSALQILVWVKKTKVLQTFLNVLNILFFDNNMILF